MVSEIPRVSVFGHCPYSVTFPYRHTFAIPCKTLQNNDQYNIISM